MPFTPFFRFADTNGNGTGSINANGNYSGAVEEFYIAPAVGETFEFHRMIVDIRDTGAFSADNYGALAGPLTNGIEVQHKTASTVIHDITDGNPVQSNAEWGSFCYDIDYVSFGSGDNFVKVRWTFKKSGKPITVNGDSSEYLAIVLNDNFTGIVTHTFAFQGLVHT